jgi:hypothetical protein
MAVWRDRRAGLGLALMSRRFPPPWSAEETDACFIVRDASGQALGYFYFEDEAGTPLGGQARCVMLSLMCVLRP